MAHILLIEPDTILGRTYAAALRKAGHQVVRSRHAQKAVHAIDQDKPDIIILELQMPGHNGVEFLYEFRSYPEWQSIPIIIHTLISPNDLKDQATQFTPLGIANFLYKPEASLRQLVNVVNEALQPA